MAPDITTVLIHVRFRRYSVQALGLCLRHLSNCATCAHSTEITPPTGPANRRQLPTAVTLAVTTITY
jgi:hypothetical protein